MINSLDQKKVLITAEKVIFSGQLGTGERQSALLRYLLTEELAGRGDALKAYTIGVDVLGRGERFDPAQDAIVRVEMGRLRKSLQLYFATQGQNEPFSIIIDKGSYRPKFQAREVALTSIESPRESKNAAKVWIAFVVAMAVLMTYPLIKAIWNGHPDENSPDKIRVPRLIVVPINTAIMDHPQAPAQASIQAALTSALRRASWFSIELEHPRQEPDKREVVFTLRSILGGNAGQYVLTATLEQEPGHTVLWNTRYDTRDEKTTPDIQITGLVQRLARDIGALNGPIVEAIALRSLSTSSEADTPFRCMINVRRYLRYNEKKQFLDSKTCLMHQTARNSAYKEMRAMLALLLLEEAQYPHLSPLPTTIDGRAYASLELRREALLNQAQDVLTVFDPNDRATLAARLFLAACRDERAKISENLPTLTALQSSNGDAHIALALLAGPLLGEWPIALQEEEKGIALKAAPLPWYQYTAATKAALDDNPTLALRLLTRFPVNESAIGLTMLVAFSQESGILAPARAARRNLKQIGYPDDQALITLVDGGCYTQDIRERIKRGLRQQNAPE